MPEEMPEICPRQELIEAFARDKVDESQRREAEALLGSSEECRAYFRKLTAGRYPKLPNYTIIGQVGKGGFGVVYKAVHHEKERAEALKVLFSQTTLLTEYFQNEVHLIARLRHPNIATLYDAQLSTAPLYYTMEFVDGERLNDYIKRGDVSLAERVRLIQAVADAVGYAHKQGVVHRDLKPQNILVDEEGQARVVDFGISIKLAEETGAPEAGGAKSTGRQGPVGTLGYIAPEQEKGKQVDARADIYALGALLFHCITGEPARLANVADQRIRILRERKVVQPDDLDAIIGRCVEERPEDRYATCEEFSLDLGNYLAGRMIQARGKPSIPYQMMRIGAVVMRDWPGSVRMAVVISVAAFLTAYFWQMETNARYVETPGKAADETVMIGFGESTTLAIMEGRIGTDLPDLSAFAPTKSWRMLYGRLLERLAVASPRVILIDSYINECAEEFESHFDEVFIEGIKAVQAPVLTAANTFDVNGEPEICDKYRDVLAGCGAILGVDPRKHRDHFETTYCIERGLGLPIPGLALAAYTAAEHPDCIAELQLDADSLEVCVKYRKRNPVRGKSNYLDDTDYFPLITVESYKAGNKALTTFIPDVLLEGDILGNALVGAQPNSFWESEHRTLFFEDVLTASDEQIREWCHDKAIVIGQMIGQVDHIERQDGSMMYGCQLHAEALNNLFARGSYRRFHPKELATRNILWCALGGLSVSLIRKRRWQTLSLASMMCAIVFFVGIMIGGKAALSFASERYWVEILIALAGLLTAGSLAFLTKAAQERLYGMIPSTAGAPAESRTLDSTMLAETR